MRRAGKDRNPHGEGEGRGGLEMSWSVRRKDRQSKDFAKTHLCVNYLLPRQAEGSHLCVEGVGRGEIPTPPMNYAAVK